MSAKRTKVIVNILNVTDRFGGLNRQKMARYRFITVKLITPTHVTLLLPNG
jgi:hypothetical protein